MGRQNTVVRAGIDEAGSDIVIMAEAQPHGSSTPIWSTSLIPIILRVKEKIELFCPSARRFKERR